jgi:hypothetical protein
MMRGRALAALLGAIAVAAAWSGCGSESSRTVPTSALAQPEFAKQVEAICTRGRLRGLEYRPASDPEQSDGDAIAERIEGSLVPAIEGVVDEIYELGAPPGEREQIEKLAVALQGAVEKAKETDVRNLERFELLLGRAGKLARQQNLEACIYS